VTTAPIPDEGQQLPPAAFIEILERGTATDDTAAGSVVTPDCIRVNGMWLLVEPNIRINDLGDRQAATVTVTLYARRIVVGAEGDLAEETGMTAEQRQILDSQPRPASGATPFRRRVRHAPCMTVTVLPLADAEQFGDWREWLRCIACHGQFPVADFTWIEDNGMDGPVVGT
jgi:hypothetical protein